jgi:hypothetical protein
VPPYAGKVGQFGTYVAGQFRRGTPDLGDRGNSDSLALRPSSRCTPLSIQQLLQRASGDLKPAGVVLLAMLPPYSHRGRRSPGSHEPSRLNRSGAKAGPKLPHFAGTAIEDPPPKAAGPFCFRANCGDARL